MICQLCGDETELLEHHFSYSDGRHGLYAVEIVIEVCMMCHKKIHKEDEYYDELDPVALGDPFTSESARQYENIMTMLVVGSDDVTWDDLSSDAGPNEKYYMYKDDAGNCQYGDSTGEVCGEDLPCSEHGHEWRLEIRD